MNASARRRGSRIARAAGLAVALPGLVLGLVVTGGAMSAVAVGTWLPPADISAPTTYADGPATSSPVLAASADGRRVLALWSRFNGAHWVAQTSRSVDGGSTWTAPIDLNPVADADFAASHVAISTDGSRAVLLLTGWEGDVYVRASADAGASWGSAQLIGPGGHDPRAVVSDTGSRVTVAWSAYQIAGGASHWAIQSRSSTDGGVTWADVVRVSSYGDSSEYVDLRGSPDGRTLAAAWNANLNTGVEAGFSTDGGATWTVSTVSTTTAVVHSKSLAAAANGRVSVTWVEATSGAVKARSTIDLGQQWSAVMDLASTGAAPQVTTSANGSRTTVLWFDSVWNDARSEYDNLVTTRSSSDGGVTWGPSVRLSANVSSYSLPRLSGSGDGLRLTAVWTVWSDAISGDVVYVAESSDGGASWSTPIGISRIDNGSSGPSLAASSDGTTVVAAWVQYLASTTSLVRARAKVEPPAIVSVTPSSGPTTGGTSVGILGSGFGGASSVTFGSTPASSFTVWSSGHITATSPPGSPGTVGVTVTTAAGSSTLPTAFSYVAVDTTPPVTRMVTPSSPVSLSSTIRVTFTGLDVGGAVASYQVQRALKAPGGAVGGYVDFGGPRTTASVTMTGAKPGYGYCFRANGTDTAGNVSAWSAPVCQTLPGDDRVLVGRTGWSRVTVKSAYLRTLTTSRTKGATLVLAKSRGSALTLVVNKVPGGGTLGVYVKGKKVATVPTTARRAALKVPVTLKVRTAGAPVVLRLDAPGARGIAIDGIAQLP